MLDYSTLPLILEGGKIAKQILTKCWITALCNTAINVANAHTRNSSKCWIFADQVTIHTCSCMVRGTCTYM